MKTLGTFQSARWGTVTVVQATYLFANGPIAIILQLANGEKLANLSANMYRPECSRDSKDLAVDCFYVKTWDSPDLVKEALASGLFRERGDLPPAESGHVTSPVWQIVRAAA